jgi:hypothetical protein
VCARSWLPTLVSDCASSAWRLGSISALGQASVGGGHNETPRPPSRRPPPPAAPPPQQGSPPDSPGRFGPNSSGGGGGGRASISCVGSDGGERISSGYRQRRPPPPPAAPPPPLSFAQQARAAAAEASRATHPLSLILQRLANKPAEEEEDEVKKQLAGNEIVGDESKRDKCELRLWRALPSFFWSTHEAQWRSLCA